MCDWVFVTVLFVQDLNKSYLSTVSERAVYSIFEGVRHGDYLPGRTLSSMR
ncbi:hypothetical protein DENIT_11358 [Pseudomonas veronii]|nr:hypothetical protein DENIT_11358 [Pseudomonas veronii]